MLVFVVAIIAVAGTLNLGGEQKIRSELTHFLLLHLAVTFGPSIAMISKKEETPKVAAEVDDDEPDDW